MSSLTSDFRLVDNEDDLFIANLETQQLRVGAFPIEGVPSFLRE